MYDTVCISMEHKQALAGGLQEYLLDKIRALAARKFGGIPGLALKLGKKSSNFYHIFNGRNSVSLHFVEECCEALGVSLAELISSNSGAYYPSQSALLAPDESKFRAVPMLSPSSCGHTGIVSGGAIEGWKYFDESFLVNFFEPVMTIAKGQSMEPKIHDGDLIMIDTNPSKRVNPSVDDMFFVNNPDTLEESAYTIKRVIHVENKLFLVPLNSDYQIQTVELDGRSIEDVVLGVVVWIGHEVSHFSGGGGGE